MKVQINLSNRHLHLSKEDIKKLFGENYKLTEKRELMQPDYFEVEETVNLIGPKGISQEMHIVMPERPESQCEILQSDTYRLGFKDVPVRESGDIENTPAFILEGPNGKVEIEKGLIIAQRHIHMDQKTADENKIKNGQTVAIRVGKKNKEITFHDVVIRIKDGYIPECHLDFDEGNAAGIGQGTFAEVLNSNKRLNEKVQVIIFREIDGKHEYLLLKRTAERGGVWQFVTGGVDETDTSIKYAAFRETEEETGIEYEKIIKIYEDIYSFQFKGFADVIKTEHVFALQVEPTVKINLENQDSLEHSEYKWVNFAEAMEKVSHDSARNALESLKKVV